MKKKITIILPILICFILTGIFILFSVFTAGNIRDSKETKFGNDGYIIADTSDESVNKVRFGNNTPYKKNTESTYLFKDVSNNDVIVQDDTFIHYDNNSMSSFKKGVVVNLADIEAESINHYGIAPFSVLEQTGENYAVKGSKDSVLFNEFIWKISEERYLLSSASNLLVFSEEETIE